MSKRRQPSAGTSLQTTKRLKFDNFGAANATDDMALAHVAGKQQRSTVSTGVSTRAASLAPGTFPSLASLAISVFASNFRKLFIPGDNANPERGREVRESILALPDTLIPKVLASLRMHCPTFLSGEVLSLYFLRGREICLTDAFPGVTTKVMHAIPPKRNPEILTSLELSGLEKINDQVFESVVSRLPGLEKLVLRGCTKAGPLALQAVATTCPELKNLNMNYTVATPQSIMAVLFACPRLQVLKIAGIPKMTAGCIATLVKTYLAEHPDEDRIFPALQTLKIRLTALSDADLASVLHLCPNLRTLDISFTPIKHFTLPSDAPLNLRKLNLTSTAIPAPELVQLLDQLPDLEKLHLGALGEAVPITSKGVGVGTGAGTITDMVLFDVTEALVRCDKLELVNLVGNLKLGTTKVKPRALWDFIARVGRKCKILNLENVPNLRSDDLEGLLPNSSNDLPSPIRSLNLARTGVDDDAAIFISACHELRMLNLSGTKIGQDGLFTILDSCPDVHELDLTGCRSIKVLDRRRFFEVKSFAK
ncbi:EIN3-binding F-box protein 1 [Ceratobasidium sp. AG-Ba]|nr:EIN3-binding F-box protein 1 [Ceratobasidium sp. AG-Ba]